MKRTDLSQFNLTVRKETGFAVLSTEGYINHLGEKIEDECKSLINSGHKKIVLNLERSRAINSIGLIIFVEIIEKLQQVNGIIYFCGLTPIIEKSFRIMGFTQCIRVFKTEREAIESIQETSCLCNKTKIGINSLYLLGGNPNATHRLNPI